MELNLNEDDIKKHLQDLGYRNIPERKLAIFVDDLRRLIKYEERKKQIDEKLKNLENQEPRQTRASPGLSHDKIMKQNRSSRDNRPTIGSHNSRSVSGSGKDDSNSTRLSSTTSGGVDISEEEPSLYVDVLIPRAESADKRLPNGASLLEPKSGVIRCRSSQPTYKSRGVRERAADPVSLHQEYKKAWQKLNLPGETSHSKLRWAVRGWMMGEEPT